MHWLHNILQSKTKEVTMEEENNESYEVIATSYDLSKINKGYLILKGSGNPNEKHELIGVMLDNGVVLGDIEQVTKVDDYGTDVTSEKLLHTGELLF
tara:strand:+ start:664 stop:954 length:291 start_codon:yes stop_codon:yes gene_type:complete